MRRSFTQPTLDGFDIGAQVARDKLRQRFEAEQRQKELDSNPFVAEARARLARNQAGPSADDLLEGEVRRLKLQRERAALTNPQATGTAPPDESDDLARQVRQLKLRREFETLNNPPAQSDEDALAGEVRRLKLQRERDALVNPAGPAAQPAPRLAKITRKLPNDVQAVFDVPQTDLAKFEAPAAPTSTPFSVAIAQTEEELAKQQIEQAAGDNRTGLFNLFSRGSIVTDKQQQLLKLRRDEIKHLLTTGQIDRAEANRRAAALLAK